MSAVERREDVRDLSDIEYDRQLDQAPAHTNTNSLFHGFPMMVNDGLCIFYNLCVNCLWHMKCYCIGFAQT